MFSDVWSENAALFKRLMKIHSNSPILYGFKPLTGQYRSFAIYPFYPRCYFYHNQGVRTLNGDSEAKFRSNKEAIESTIFIV